MGGRESPWEVPLSQVTAKVTSARWRRTESYGDVRRNLLTVQSRPASCLGARGSRSKFNVPLGVESQGFCVLG
jgi:hypothetical protein